MLAIAVVTVACVALNIGLTALRGWGPEPWWQQGLTLVGSMLALTWAWGGFHQRPADLRTGDPKPRRSRSDLIKRILLVLGFAVAMVVFWVWMVRALEINVDPIISSPAFWLGTAAEMLLIVLVAMAADRFGHVIERGGVRER